MAGPVVRSSLLSCPAEIRQRIYQPLFVLILNADSEYFTPLTRDERTKPQGPIYPAILRTCRMIHAEASAMLYGKNRFTFYGSDDLLRFVKSVGDANACLIRDVSLTTRVPLVKNAEMEDALARASGLRMLNIQSHTMSCAGPAMSYIIGFYRAMKPILERHPSLQRAMSRWPRGHLYRKDVHSLGRPWQAIVVAFAAEDVFPSPEETLFELGAVAADMEEQLKEFQLQCAKRFEKGESQKQLGKFRADWEERTAKCMSEPDQDE